MPKSVSQQAVRPRTQERQMSVSPMIWVYDGGEIPKWGGAIKDGDFYWLGERWGRVLSIETMVAGNWYIVRYLASTR